MKRKNMNIYIRTEKYIIFVGRNADRGGKNAEAKDFCTDKGCIPGVQ